MGSIYSKIKNINSDINSILFINRQANKTTKPDIEIIFMTLYKPHTEQLGIVIISYIVCIQCNTIRRNQDITVQGKLWIYIKDIINTKTSKKNK